MVRLLRLLLGIFIIAAQRELAHRANLLFEALLTATGLAAGLAALGVVYDQVETLAGWRLGEAVVLLGTYSVVSGIRGAFIDPNLAWFADPMVRQGRLDDLLLQPVPSIFLASLGVCQPWALAQVALGLVTIAFGVRALESGLTAVGVFSWLVLLLAGVAITWATRVLLACLAFWAPYVEPEILYGAFWQLGRYPVGIYHPAVRALLTYVVPVAFIATIPARALTRWAGPLLLLGGLAAAIGAVLVANLVWYVGLRRYTSATS